jgi:predicted MFS family arabinose efflux permease
VRPLGGWLIARQRATTIALMRGSQLINLAGLSLLAFPGRPLPVAMAGGIALGIGVALPYAAVFNTAAASLPRAPGAAQSLTAIGGTLGAVIGAPLMGAAIERFGFTAAWAAIAIFPLAALTGTVVMRGEEQLGIRETARSEG